MNNLTGTYWYVPTQFLPAVEAGTDPMPHVSTVVDQTVWRFQTCENGYVTGISATNTGDGWSYTMIVGSIAPSGLVKLSFSPLHDDDAAITIGDGTFARDMFVMQMTAGSSTYNLTHWAQMEPIDPSMPEWRALPGYPDTGVEDLKELLTPIVTT
ncbi:MAG: hypothetical protein JOZ72_14365 [Alphaproteobacteria bacterium]|nr:hypothetical protein [Alphaproteobacteria bacterium]